MIPFLLWLNERYDTNYNNLIVVDIQPDYSKNIHFLPEFAQFLINTVKQRKKIIYFYNGQEVGGSDDAHSIIFWLLESLNYEEEEMDEVYGLLMHNIIWIDKGYGFFRNWMDQDVSDDVIIKVIRLMVIKKINDSRQLDEEELNNLGVCSSLYQDGIHLPNISLNQLKQFNGSYLCGGGRDECLKEVQLLMNAFNIKYTLLNRFIY